MSRIRAASVALLTLIPAFTLGTAEQTGLDDLVALEANLGTHNPYTPVIDVRITRLN